MTAGSPVDSRQEVWLSPMTFINLSLLFGLGLAALPVILHLMMRARPKRIEFPALRLLAARRTSNARRMKLRHLLLLLLRIALLIIFVLALTRPSLPPARYALVWYEWLLLLGVATAAVVLWRILSHRTAKREPAEFLRRERLARLRAGMLMACLLAVLLIVGVPWGLRVRAEIRAPNSDLAEDVPVATVFIFDTSLSMSYRHESATRLESAGRIASDYMQMLPQGSRVAVSSTAPDDDPVFQADLAGAQSRIESLRTVPRIDPLNRALLRAVDAQKQDQSQVREELGTPQTGDLFSREVIILTDLSKSSWTIPDESGLRDLLLEYDWLKVFVVDVSVDNPVNLSLRNLRLAQDSTVAGRSVDLSVDVVRTEAAQSSVNVNVYVVNDAGQESRPTAPVHLELETTSGTARMSVPVDVDTTSLSGRVRLSSADPLQADDVRYFSLGVQPRPSVLLIGDRKDEEDVVFLRAALEANTGGRGSRPFYDCTFARTSQFRSQPLSEFDVVCLVNCQRPGRQLWDTLQEWVEDGGSLFTVAGGNPGLSADTWSNEHTADLLPAQVLVRRSGRRGAETLRIETTHPIIRPFEYNADAKTELLVAPVLQWWRVEPHPDARVILSYTGDRNNAALLERRVGEGRSLMLTTAVYYDADEKKMWNDLPDRYTFLMLAEGIVQYLTGASDQRRNFITGDPVEVQLPAGRQFDRYLLRRPGPRQTSGPLEPGQRSVLIDDADAPGTYRLLSPPESAPFDSGFSVNTEDMESDLTPIKAAELQQILGNSQYTLVKTSDELQRQVRVGRLGIEVFPVLLGLLVIFFCGEHLMANYFYDQEPAPADEPAVAG